MIPFSPPRIDQATIDAVTEVLKSGWITTGPKTKEFERRINEYVGAKRTFCCNANTNGMELMLRWLGIGPGDEVIIPAYTYAATANVVMHLGANPVMVDVKLDFTIDTERVAQAINPRTKAIIPVDLGGLPADYNALWKVINEHKSSFVSSSSAQFELGRIALISDSAHSIGAEYNGQKLGSQADAMVFSFHAVKNLTTAEGGAICINLPEKFDHSVVYDWLNSRSLHGQTKDALSKTSAGGWEYDIVDAGWKCNMTDIQAAIGLVELNRYDADTLQRRKSITEHYSSALSAFDWAILPTLNDEKRKSSYHLYLLRIKGASLSQRNKIIEAIASKGVSVNVHYKPLPMLSFYNANGYEINNYPVTKSLWENEISLPVFFDLTDEQVKEVVNAVNASVEEVLR